MNDGPHAVRLRDLGEERHPVAGLTAVDRVGDVGELPYAATEDASSSGQTRTVAIALVAVALALLIGLGLALLV